MASASLISFPLPNPKLNSIKASSSTITTTAATTAVPPQSTTQSLEEKYGRKGIKFTDTGIVEMTVRNGSSLSLQISNGHVTSYKPKVNWKDDGCEEILYTVPGDSVKGGIGLALNEVSEANPKGSPLCTSAFAVNDVDADSIDALQVELGCTCGTLDITYIVSLYPLSIATAVIVNNNGKKAVNLTSAILSYLKFRNRGEAAISGLRGTPYCSYPPLSSRFELLSPVEAMKMESPGWFSFSEPENNKPGVWTVQDPLYTLLNNKMSRVYAAPPSERLKRIYNTAPSKFEVLDKGKELVFRLIRMGFEDFYVSSPGSLSEKFGDGYFICTGPASMMVPVVVNPGEEWRGAQVIEHDNL